MDRVDIKADPDLAPGLGHRRDKPLEDLSKRRSGQRLEEYPEAIPTADHGDRGRRWAPDLDITTDHLRESPSEGYQTLCLLLGLAFIAR